MKANNLFSIILLFLLFLSGCAVNVPLKVDAKRDMMKFMPPDKKKIPATVGMYVKDDLRGYQFRQPKMGMTFYMNVGDYIVPIGGEMANTMFEKAVFVDQLPPFMGNNIPEVEAVVEPDVLFVHGSAEGALTGYVDTSIKIRVRAYDLSGKIIWEDEEVGANRSGNMDFVETFLGHMDRVGEVGYKAALRSAEKIIQRFYSNPPKQLSYLYYTDSMAGHNPRGRVENRARFESLWKKGKKYFDEKDYYQSLYYFNKAYSLAPQDQVTLFYLGVSCAYCGKKELAVGYLNNAIKIDDNSQEATNAKKWIETLKNPLKIGVRPFTVAGNIDNYADFASEVLVGNLKSSHMYELVSLAPDERATGINGILESYLGHGARVVLVPAIDKIEISPASEKREATDVATEYTVRMSIKAYSAKKKKILTEIKLKESANYLKDKTEKEKAQLLEDIIRRGLDKVIYQLLDKDII